MMILIIAMLHNEKLNRWHPIVFRESPMPGPPARDKPPRYKSAFHHTAGFETREAALAEIDGDDKYAEMQRALAADIPWDGETAPAIMAFFIPGPGGLRMEDAGELGHLADARELLNRVLKMRSRRENSKDN